MMAETCLLAETAICYPALYDELRNTTSRPTETVETVALAAVAAASEQNAGAIIVLSTSGNTARLISKYRPSVPIITGRVQGQWRGGLVLILRSCSHSQPADSAPDPPAQGMLPLLVPRASRYRSASMADRRKRHSYVHAEVELKRLRCRSTTVSGLVFGMRSHSTLSRLAAPSLLCRGGRAVLGTRTRCASCLCRRTRRIWSSSL